MKFAVYTCITGSYDVLRSHHPSNGADFICFTDDPMMTTYNKNWETRDIPAELRHLPKVKQQRLVKILPERYLKDYDVSFWVDGNIEILCDIAEFVKKYDLGRRVFWTRRHPTRNCAYAEARAVVQLKRDTRERVLGQMDKYRREGFPEGYGLEETNVILRRHGDLRCRLLDGTWAREVLSGSHRDQLSFDYARWKTRVEIGLIETERLDIDKNFRLRRHGNR